MRLLSRFALVFVTFWLLAVPGFGVDSPLDDPEAEARARALMTEIRCLVCQNQSIVDSDAGLAQDLRAIVRKRIIAGESDAEIKDFLVARYGDWVLMSPPVKGGTLLLWGSPFLLLLAGGGLWLLSRRRHGSGPSAPEPLSEAEAARLAALLEDDQKTDSAS